MTTESELPGTDPLTVARRWIVRLRSGEVTQADLDALAQWRAESHEHRRAFAIANAQWNQLREAAQNVATKPRHADRDGVSRSQVSRRALVGGAVAASIGGAILLAARPPLDLWPTFSELMADYRTEVGERRQIAFADTVSVEMNTRTSLAVDGRATEARRVELIEGQIAVTAGAWGVKPSSSFVVVAGRGRARASHATFDLRYNGENVVVTCVAGEVNVECQASQETLHASQQISYGPRGFSDIAATDGHVIEAWRRGLLVIENQPLSQVIPEINRYRRGRIVLLNDEIGRLPLDATFRLDRIDEVVPKIVQLFNLRVRALPGGVVLLS
jgi:transmembrane sensor